MACYFTDHAAGDDVHDGLDMVGLGLGGASYDHVMGSLTKVGAFGGVAVGDVIHIATTDRGGESGWYRMTNTWFAPDTVMLELWSGSGLTAESSNVTSSDGPFRTLGKALEAVAAGDRIWVRGGEAYDDEHAPGGTPSGAVGELQVAGSRGFPVAVEGFTAAPGDGGQAILDAQSGGTPLANVIRATSALTGDLFYVFRNLRFCGASGDGVGLSGGRLRFVNCESDGHGGRGIVGGGHVYVESCRSHGNGSHGVEVGAGAMVIDGDVFDNGGQGVVVGGNSLVAFTRVWGLAAGMNGIAASCGEDVTVMNCTVDGNDVANTVGIGQWGSGDLRVMNTLIRRCQVDVYANTDYGAGRLSRNNMVSGKGSSWYHQYGVEDGRVEAAAGFVDVAGHDYRLRLASPARGAGWPAFVDVGAHQRREMMMSSPTNLGVQG